MTNLKVFDLCDDIDEKKINSFSKRNNSILSVKVDYDKVETNYEWIDIMEDTVRYIDNILRNPNRFIINEEDVIKVELARRVTVESIKHLSRNTNLIQDINEKTGDVRPSKILNINKEESYDTYENRFIYSLIQNMKSYISRKKRNEITTSSLKDNKNLEYISSANIGKEKININMHLESKLNINNEKSNEDIQERIEALEQKINALTHNDVYRTIEKKHIALVTSPIKKTNLIMKNVNFQYATKLWDYLQQHIDDDVKQDKKNKVIREDDTLRQYFDEIFMLGYLALNEVNNEESKEMKENLSEKLAGSMVEKMMDLNENLSEEQLKEIISNQFSQIKFKRIASEKEIQDKFRVSIDKYLDKVKNINL